jgi:hypothetical protein
MSKLNIGYINVRGLSLEKWHYCCSLMDTTFDILFIAETWYMNKAMYHSHPYYFTQSIVQAQKKQVTGHLSGGLLVLVKPSIRSCISSFKVEKYFISLCYH